MLTRKTLNVALLTFLIIDYGQINTILAQSPSNYLYLASHIILEKGKPIQLSQNYTEVDLGDVEGTIYSDSLSQLSQVTDLRIFGKIENIESGAICSNPALRKFQIKINGTTEPLTFTKDMFKNCENLKQLWLRGASVYSNIDRDGLDNLSNLSFLYLSRLNLNHLTQDYFKNVKSLAHLTIESCGVEKIDPDVFDDLKNLKDIEIISNDVSHLPPHLFKNMTKLERLFLTDNRISDLTWDEFDGLSSLTELYLRRNNIPSFNVDKIVKYMPNLRHLEFDFSSVECKKRLALIDEVRSKLNHSFTVFSKPREPLRAHSYPGALSCDYE